MTYTRILFNHIKEYTPNAIKTIPYAKSSKPVNGTKPQVGWKTFKDPQTIKVMRFFKRNVIDDTASYQVFFFLVIFGLTSIMFYPALWVYRTNNAHRNIDYAIKKEEEYKAKLAASEENEEE